MLYILQVQKFTINLLVVNPELKGGAARSLLLTKGQKKQVAGKVIQKNVF